MRTKEAVKKNQSSMQVLKTLQVLLEDNYTMAELIHKLNANESEPIFNNSVVSKYINTCRFCGVDIPKIQNKYFVASIPFGMNLAPKERDLIEELRYAVKNTMSTKADEDFEVFLTKLNKYSNKEIIRLEPKTQQKAFELFDRAIAEKRKVNLLFRANAVFECIPLKIIEKKGKPCFSIIHDGKEKTVSAKRITGLEILDKKFEHPENFAKQEVVFKLTGNLAKNYTPREYETVIDNSSSDYIVISNRDESKQSLFKRFLRYTDCCEIIFPTHYRSEMKDMLNKMLENYGV